MPVNQPLIAVVPFASLSVALTDLAAVRNRTSIHPGTSTASVEVDTDGYIRLSLQSSSTPNTPFQWLLAGSASDVEVRFDPSSGSVSSGTVNQWIALDINTGWSVSTGDVKDCSGTIRLRNRVTGTELASASMSMHASMEVVDSGG